MPEDDNKHVVAGGVLSPTFNDIFAARPVPGIYAKMHSIMTDSPVLQKLGNMPMGGKTLKFLAIDDILAAIRPFFIEQKVIIVPTLVEHHTDIGRGQEAPAQPIKKADGSETTLWSGSIPAMNYREKVVYDFRFIDVEDGSSVTARVSGEAKDTQDKSSGKAITSAFKSALIKTFMLITGDPEIEDGTAEEPAAPKVDRGTQQRNAAGAGGTTATATARATKPAAEPKPSVTTTPQVGDTETPLDVAKALLVSAKEAREKITGETMSKEAIDKIGFDLFGVPRTGWINTAVKVKKIAEAIAAGEAA